MAASRSTDGAIVATNDDVTYSITPQTLLVSEGDTVLYRDTWSEYHKAGFPAGSTTPSTTAAPSTATTTLTTTTPVTTTPTVSTTTVTLTPTG
jgi:plastocyanin